MPGRDRGRDRRPWPVTVVLSGLVVLVALDLALIVAISDPFRDPMRVVPARLEAVCDELESGQFGPLLDASHYIGTIGADRP